MTSTNQTPFLTRIKSALNVSTNRSGRYPSIFPDQPRDEIQKVLDKISGRSIEQQRRLFDQLKEMGKPINLNVIATKNTSEAAKAIAILVREKKPEWGDEKHIAIWRHPLIDKLKLAEVLTTDGIYIHQTTFVDGEEEMKSRQRIRQEIIASFVGVTSADYCVAESATLVMKNRPGRARTASLVPTIHIAVIRFDQIIANLNELYTLIKHDPQYNQNGLTNCLTFISGPSKTADIEAVMVHGAHGPRELFLFVIMGDTV